MPEAPAEQDDEHGEAGDDTDGEPRIGIPYSEETVAKAINQVEKRIKQTQLLPERW